MGKRQRERKAVKVDIELAEKNQIALRKKERLAPTVKIVRKTAGVLLVTIVILYVGIIVNNSLPEILVRLVDKG